MSVPNTPRFRRGLVLTIVAAVVLMCLFLFLRPTAVQVVSLEEREIVSALAAVGRVRVPSRAGLGVSISGTVGEIRVREGDSVSAGDVLLVLDDREARALLREAQAVLAETRASTGAAIAEAEREADLARLDLRRIRSVFEEGALTRQTVDQAEQRAADAASRLASLQAEGDVGEGQPAAVVRAQAALDAAGARLDLTRVTAPADGVILVRQVEPGDAVSPGRVLLDMAFDGPIELVVFPGEENLGDLRPGVPATATADAFPERVFDATVSLVAPSVDRNQGTVEVRLTVPRPPDYLRPDMTVSINIETGRRPGAVVLTEDAVQGLATAEPWVGIVQDGRLVRRVVELGLRGEGYVEILSGLEEHEPVVVNVEDLEPGDRVRPSNGRDR